MSFKIMSHGLVFSHHHSQGAADAEIAKVEVEVNDRIAKLTEDIAGEQQFLDGLTIVEDLDAAASILQSRVVT